MKDYPPPGYMKPVYTAGQDVVFRLDNEKLHKCAAEDWDLHTEMLLAEGKIKRISNLVPCYIPTGKRIIK